MDENFVGVGDRIQSKLDDLGLKQVNVLEKTGLSKNALSNYISGNRIPDNKSLYKLAKFFNVSMEWLLTGESAEIKENQVEVESYDSQNTEQLTEKEVELLSIFEHIPEEQKDLAINVLKPFIKEGAATKEHIEIPDRIRKKRKPVLNKKGSSYSSTGTTDRYASRMNA